MSDNPQSNFIRGLPPDDLGELVVWVLERFEKKLDHVSTQLMNRMDNMSQTFDSALSGLTGKITTLQASVDQMGRDVAAEIATLQSGPLNPQQQTAVDNLQQLVDRIVTSVGDIDTSALAASAGAGGGPTGTTGPTGGGTGTTGTTGGDTGVTGATGDTGPAPVFQTRRP